MLILLLLHSDIVTFFSNDICLNTINFSNIDLDDNFDNCDSEIVNHVRLMAWCNEFNAKYKKRDEKLIQVCSMVWNKMVRLAHFNK